MSERKKFLNNYNLVHRRRVISLTKSMIRRTTLDDDLSVPLLKREELFFDKQPAHLSN